MDVAAKLARIEALLETSTRDHCRRLDRLEATVGRQALIATTVSAITPTATPSIDIHVMSDMNVCLRFAFR